MRLWSRATPDRQPDPDALSVPQLVSIMIQPAIDRMVGSIIPALICAALIMGLIAGLMGGLLAAALT